MPFAVVDQKYEIVPVTELQPHPDNPHVGAMAVLAESIEHNGFYGAVLAQRSTGYILAGNWRYKAALEKGAATIPVIWADVDDERARRILTVDNRATDLAGYDDEALAKLLGGLEDLTGTGYTAEDLEDLLGTEKGSKAGVLHDQSVQMAPQREYVLVVADTTEEWEKLRAALSLGVVRRGGYKPGSVFDDTGPARVAKAADVLRLITQKGSNAAGSPQ